MLVMDVAGQAFLLPADRGCHAHDLTHAANRLHHANRAQCFMRDRDVAYANTNRIPEAREELAAFDESIKVIPDEWTMGNQPANEIMPLARWVLEGEIEFKAGNRTRGLALLGKAVELEERLKYAEPAPWMMPARHAYGALLIVDGQYKAAEKIYLRDLEVFPANGWALLGLRDSLRGQDRMAEAGRIDESFRRAWASADVMPPASCYCGASVADAD
jgi:tetratricopeptide (TPR) repeat protein